MDLNFKKDLFKDDTSSLKSDSSLGQSFSDEDNFDIFSSRFSFDVFGLE